MEKTTLKVEGLHCNGCVRTVTNAIKRVAGVSEANVSLENEEAIIEFDEKETDLEKIRKAVDEAGYRLAA
jgi:copper chaperone